MAASHTVPNPAQVLGRNSRQQLAPRWRGLGQPAVRATGSQTVTEERTQRPCRLAQRSRLLGVAHNSIVRSVAAPVCCAAWQSCTRRGESGGASSSAGSGASFVLQSCSRGAPVAVSGHCSGGGEHQQQHRHQPVALRAGVPVTAMDCESVSQDRGRDAGVRPRALHLEISGSVIAHLKPKVLHHVLGSQ